MSPIGSCKRNVLETPKHTFPSNSYYRVGVPCLGPPYSPFIFTEPPNTSHTPPHPETSTKYVYSDKALYTELIWASFCEGVYVVLGSIMISWIGPSEEPDIVGIQKLSWTRKMARGLKCCFHRTVRRCSSYEAGHAITMDPPYKEGYQSTEYAAVCICRFSFWTSNSMTDHIYKGLWA